MRRWVGAARRPLAEGWLVLAPLAGLAAALAGRGHRTLTLLALGTATAVAAALRDPERTPPATTDRALAPADGRVVQIRRVEDAHFGVEMMEISIFLALWHVHVQRAPLAGRVTRVEVAPGGFRPALFAGAAENYRRTIYLETEWGPCAVSQMAGLIARRIVGWVKPGENVFAGQRLGMIKFGSRVALRLPATCRPLVGVGDVVRAGLTPIAARE
ncbi:MAG TPA: phosphatidylserine decarboxylase [Chloroflexota bacterium]|nr:phosphatidylserine decarboxylase [Chloroflexota bacterium]